MTHFRFQETKLQGLIEIEPFFAPDERGYMSKVFEKEVFAAHGIEMELFEELQAFSKR